MNGILYMNVSVLEDQKLFEKSMSMVSEERKEKVKKHKNALLARLSLGAGVLLHIAMEKNGLHDRWNDIVYGSHGKPFLKNSDFYFNLSHSGEYVICVYGDVPLGVDLQQIKEYIPKHTKKILSEEEEYYLHSLDNKTKSTAFYQIWARKESLIKWDGRGLRISLTELNTVSEKKLTDEILFENRKCFFTELDFLLPEYAICICSEKRFSWNDMTEVTSDFLTKY